jgi:uncharacterized protein (DUF2147 family)
MKKIILNAMTTLLLLLVVFNIRANNEVPGSEIVGRYRLPNQLEIEIYPTEKGYTGKIVALNNFENGQTKDLNNRDKKEREKPLLGKVIIEELTYDADSEQWSGGTMYAPEKGMTVNLKVKSVNDSVAVAEGSKLLFKKTINWERIH